MKKTFLFVACMMLGSSAAALVKGPAEDTAAMIQRAGKELLDMAEDKEFPDTKLDFKATPEVRSFAEQLLHAAKGNMLFLDFVNGKKPDFSDLPRDKYKTRADIVKVLKQSVDDLAAAAKKAGDKGMAKQVKHPFGSGTMSTQMLFLMPVGHMAEHYGQLVIYYRLNKVVPPETRHQNEHPPQP